MHRAVTDLPNHPNTAEMSLPDRPLTVCDLTQSYAPTGGGGISTYLKQKRDYVLEHTDHTLLQIVPGPEDRITRNGRHIFAEVGADQVRGSPNYRFILRTGQVHAILEEFLPDVVESLCPWVLPWAAIRHRRRFPHTALVAGYRTDFPEAHVYRVMNDLAGHHMGMAWKWLSYGYAEITYREFDRVYTLSEFARANLRKRRLYRLDKLPLGVNTERFDPGMRDPAYRREIGLSNEGPLLVYAGRIDNEKRADRLIAMMRHLPAELDAGLVLIGDGKLREDLMAEAARDGLPVAFPGFEEDRTAFARALASSDIYVSAMADETFGISVLEAQASALPVVGVASGAMPDRVPEGLGLLGPVDDVEAMARNVVSVWQSPDRAAMGEAAREHALGFSWNATFAKLFGEIYPRALAEAGKRVETGAKRPRWLQPKGERGTTEHGEIEPAKPTTSAPASHSQEL